MLFNSRLAMNDTQKPFACSEKDCEMTFTNEDHLNWHRKKHDMMLNLGLSKNNDVADQTPTPTRFIRNCEEVGLFQDLQNVNPFDEFFKKAVDLAKNGGTLEVPETNSDDTLHTPHILPHIEQNQKKINNTNNRDDNNSQSNDFSLNNVIPITTTTENACENDNNITGCDSTPVIVIEDDSDNEKDIKQKIKEALQNKEKQKIEKENLASAVSTTSIITVVPFQNLAIASEKPSNRIEKEKYSNINSEINLNTVDDSREKIREMNRAAQIRCRKRKQMRWKEMEEELSLLKEENKKLKLENYNLQFQLMQIKEKSLNASKGNQRKDHVSTTEPVQATIIGTLIPVDHQKAPERGPTFASPNGRNCTVLPQIRSQKNKSPTTPNPIVIQILPSTSTDNTNSQNHQPSVKIDTIHNLSSLVTNLNEGSEQKKIKKKNLRKIIPKIRIEN